MKLLGQGSLSSVLEAVLNVACFVVWLCVVMWVVLAFVDPSGEASFSFPMAIEPGPLMEPGVLEHSAESHRYWRFQPIAVQVQTPHDPALIASLLAALLFALLGIVLWELRAIFKSLRDGSPFIARNARRLRLIGLAVLGYEALRVAVTIVVITPAIEGLGPGSFAVRPSPWPTWHVVFLGFAVLVLAEVFRRGAAMRDEQDLTV